METFFKTIKAELVWRQSWPTRRQAEAAIFQYIKGVYNTRRRHSYPAGISPLAFEAKVDVTPNVHPFAIRVWALLLRDCAGEARGCVA